MQVTQIAYEKSKSFESNLMWVTQCIATVCALGRSAVLPLVDASGAFDSLSWRFIDWTFKRNEVDDKGRALFRCIYESVRGERTQR